MTHPKVDPATYFDTIGRDDTPATEEPDHAEGQCGAEPAAANCAIRLDS